MGTTYGAVHCFDKTTPAIALKNNVTRQPWLYWNVPLGSGITPIRMQTDTAMLADIPSTELASKEMRTTERKI